jgi:hypothetical protein
VGFNGNVPPEKPVKPATESVESRVAQGGEPIRAEAYLWYIEHRIGETNAAQRELSALESRCRRVFLDLSELSDPGPWASVDRLGKKSA